MSNIDFNKVKLVVWDLDDTFWSGTLSEGPVDVITRNTTLVKRLTDIGIVNAVCSKNDAEPALTQLKEYGVEDLFVFNSINWEPKGKRISALIKDMGLRPVNVLFIDDNTQNLNEALYYEPTLMVATPDILADLCDFAESKSVTDPTHKRLKQYKVLEQKHDSRSRFSDNIEFLYDTDTQVDIHHDCLSVVDRIHELILRTNQLNFTKWRCSMEELLRLLNDPSVEAGYATVKDRFGDYGIVGFYALKDGKLLHFLFSCRTIGQGVEQYVYATIGHPELTVVGDVVNNVTNDPAPQWINQTCCAQQATSNTAKYNDKKIIIKGACDLSIVASFLASHNIIQEFTYVGEKNNRIEHHNHSVNINEWYKIPDADKKFLLDTCIFNDKNMFTTHIYDDDVAIIFLSTQIEPHLGIYRHKATGRRIAYGEWGYPITDPENWDGLINHTIPAFDNNFTKEWLSQFATDWEYLGPITLDQYIANIELLLSRINPNAKLCLLLGSEIPYEANKQFSYIDRHLTYREYNTRLRQLSANNPRILLLDFSKYITSQADFLDNINHYQRRIYYQAANEVADIISTQLGSTIHRKNIINLWLDVIALKTRQNLNRDSFIFHSLRALYRIFRKPHSS